MMRRCCLALLFVTNVVLVSYTNADWVFTTCARMNDGPVGEKVANVACVTSCKYHNCGTGNCVFKEGRPACHCARCANGGGEWPISIG